jgi:hypothetical protein
MAGFDGIGTARALRTGAFLHAPLAKVDMDILFFRGGER